jgi:surfeit locus 1 family protein
MTRFRRLVWPAALTVVMLGVLVALGTWQVQRLQWKRAILRQIDGAEASPPVALPADPRPFGKVRVEGRFRADLLAFYGAEVRQTPRGPQMGAQLIEPLERPAAPAVLVDRGWVPLSPAPWVAPPGGPAAVEGYVRPPDSPGLFSAKDDPAARRFFTLDPASIGAGLGFGQVAPFTLVALGPPPPELYPEPARSLPRPVNNHLSYAITWYGLAASLVVVFAIWARQTLSEGGPHPADRNSPRTPKATGRTQA